MALVRLTIAGGYAEAQLIKGLLETEGIQTVIQGESRNTDMGTEAGFGEILILVNEDEFEAARQILEAQPLSETPSAGASAEGAVCPVHEAAAVAICSRCGSHLCEKCGPLGTPPLCESCDERLSKEPRKRTNTRVVAWVLLALFFGLPTLVALIASALVKSR